MILGALAATGCTHHDSSGSTAENGQFLDLYNWSDYIAPDTVSNFEKQTGIKVRSSYYDSNETLRTRMLAGHSGFDVVVPSATFFHPEVASGAYEPLDQTLVPNSVHQDPAIRERVALSDPNNTHSVVYMWGTIGMGVNRGLVAKVLPAVALDTWRLIFEPENAAKLAPCGINVIDEPTGIVEIALQYLGKDPHSSNVQDLADVDQLLTRLRPYVRNIDTSGEIEAMANGDVCVALGYNGNMVQARNRAKAAGKDLDIGFFIPREGSALWFTLLAIPRGAPHLASAHGFINYVLEPQVIAGITNAVGYANGVPASTKYLAPSIANDPAIYPPPDQMKRLFVVTEGSPEFGRAITRLWQKFKTGQ